MTKFGITGHQLMPARAVDFATLEIRSLLDAANKPIVGISSLAEGADQIFADEVLATGSELWAVVPSRCYESSLTGQALTNFRRLLASSTHTVTLDFDSPNESAFDAAGRWIVERCDMLVAVWDGEPSRGLGGTADAVHYARNIGRPVVTVWPDGVVRK